MNMKKVIAGVFAGAVAISAVATTMASAKTVTQSPVDKTYNFVNKKYVVSWNGKLDGVVNTTNTNGNDATGTLKVIFSNTDPDFIDDNVKISDVKLTISGASAANTNVTIEKTADMTEDDNNFNVYTVKLYGTGVTAVSDGIPLSVFDAAYGTNPSSEKKVNVTLTYTIKDKTASYSTSQKAKTGKSVLISSDSNENSTLNITTTANFNATSGTKKDLADAIATSLNVTNGATQKATFTNVGEDGKKITANDLIDLDNLVADRKLGTSIINDVEGTKGAEVTFKFKAPAASNDENDNPTNIVVPGIDLSSVTSGKDFGIMVNDSNRLVQTGVLKDYAITFKWDDIVNQTGLYINSAGLIRNIKVKAAKDLVLESINVKVPGLTYDTLSAGESVADTTAAITSATAADTTAATEATTTAAASNPKTGNAPVALAVIPVAIAAAAIIAKKRG